MPPRNLWKMLWNIVMPVRRHTFPPPAHDGKVTPARMEEARAAHRAAKRKLDDTDNVIAHARGVLWRLRQQREQRTNGKGNEPNHRQGGG